MHRLQTLRQSIADLLRSIVVSARSVDTPVARWEWGAVAVFVIISLALGLPNLAAPSLWHDELVHVYVAKNIADTGWPALPSGNFYPSSTAYNYLLALFVAALGDDAFSVRLPSVLLGGLNTALVYFLCRAWLGSSTALWAAFFFATSPWQVGWARQARLYEFQITSYLLMLSLAWRFLPVPHPRPHRASASVQCLPMSSACSRLSILFSISGRRELSPSSPCCETEC